MRVLLSTIGSRGDVQPLLALALELQAQGHRARLCAPPDFRAFVESHGIEFVAVGPEVRNARLPKAADMRTLIGDTIAGQFTTLKAAVAGCDLVVASTALQYA